MIKQDVINSFQHIITEENIDDITQEIIRKTKLDIKIEISNDNYMCYGSNIIIPHLNYKISGFGRSEYEALKTSIINLIDQLLLEECYLNPILDSIKVFIGNSSHSCNDGFNSKNNKKLNKHIYKQTNNDKDDSIKPDITSIPTTIPLTMPITVKEISFELPGLHYPYKELIKEKDLILREMEKLVLDIMTYSKKIVDYLEQGTNTENIPKYYKCPISWELMENPVVSSEGHSYEKWAINKWLMTQNKSPITGLVLDNQKMIHNYTLKSAIDDFCLRQVKMKKIEIELQKFLMKCEYDLNDLRKYFNTSYE